MFFNVIVTSSCILPYQKVVFPCQQVYFYCQSEFFLYYKIFRLLPSICCRRLVLCCGLTVLFLVLLYHVCVVVCHVLSCCLSASNYLSSLSISIYHLSLSSLFLLSIFYLLSLYPLLSLSSLFSLVSFFYMYSLYLFSLFILSYLSTLSGLTPSSSNLFSLLTLFLSSIVLWCLCVVLCCLVGHSFARLSISRYILSLVYLLLQASLLSRTIAFFSLLDYLSFSLSVSTVSRVLTLCCLSLYRFFFVLSPSSHL